MKQSDWLRSVSQHAGFSRPARCEKCKQIHTILFSYVKKIMEDCYDDSDSESGCYYPEDIGEDNNEKNYLPNY